MSIEPADVARVDERPGWVEAVRTPAGVEVWRDEPRPAEGGRRCVVRRLPDGSRADALPEGWNARNRLVEYGGRAWRPLPDRQRAGQTRQRVRVADVSRRAARLAKAGDYRRGPRSRIGLLRENFLGMM
ncbi:hypothetical protein [Nonomuraea dietziae]|uniref:hypothetical protein n=1 Tax=Nonomuraea dietziae TaxID=65515 RepID=UPI003F4E0834